MPRKFYLVLLLIPLLAMSCKDPSSQANTVSQAGVPTTPASQGNESEYRADSIKDSLVTTPVPEAKAVLREIYKEDVEEVLGSQVSDGRYVSYWYGQQFLIDGRNYFVAFSEATPASEIEYPTPENKVTISQATYEFIDKQWQLKKVQLDVGKFGGNNKAPLLDSENKATTFSSSNEKLLFVVPTFQTAMAGVRLFSQEIFSFSESELSWQYLGHFESGADNTAGCAREADSTSPIKCAKSTASVNFVNVENNEWPIMEIQMQGTAIDAKGKVSALTAKDVVRYHYDAQSSAYKKVIQ